MSKKKKFEYDNPGTTEVINDLGTEAKKKASQYKLDAKKKSFDESLVKLEDKMVDFAIKYGKQDFRTELLVNLYDVCLEMKTAIDLIEGVNTAVQCISETMSFIDECLDFNLLVEQQSLEHKYGLFYRIKAAIRRRKVRRNMKNRINALTQRINDIFGLSNTMVEALRGSMIKMKEQMNKQTAKREKALAKKGITESTFEKSEASDILNKRLEAQGVSTDTETNSDNSGSDNTNTSTNTKPSGSNNDSPNIDDIV